MDLEQFDTTKACDGGSNGLDTNVQKKCWPSPLVTDNVGLVSVASDQQGTHRVKIVAMVLGFVLAKCTKYPCCPHPKR